MTIQFILLVNGRSLFLPGAAGETARPGCAEKRSVRRIFFYDWERMVVEADYI